MSPEEPSLKKRKLSENIFNSDVVIEIAKFISEIKDYFNLSKINKQMFNLLIKENVYSLNEIFNRNQFLLQESFPNYLFQNLNSVNIICNYKNIYLLQKFTNLQAFSIRNCKLEDKYLEHLKDLQHLRIYNCSSMNGSCLKHFPKLQTLKLKNIYSLIEENLLTLQNLQKLTIYSSACNEKNLISGKFLQNLQLLTSLSYKAEHLNSNLRLNENSLSFLTQLKKLKLKKFELTGICFENLNKLKVLILEEIKNFNEKNLLHLTNLTKLQLKFVANEITDKYLQNLHNLTELKFLTSNRNITDESLKHLINLKCLDISNCRKITGKYFNNFIHLEHLYANFLSKLKDNYLIDLKNLKTLEISNCCNVTGECLLNLNNLTNLNISSTKISENYLINLVNLKNLNIEKCHNVVFGDFLLNMNKLESLYYASEQFNKEHILKTKLSIEKGDIFLVAIYGNKNTTLELNVKLLKEICDKVREKSTKK